MIRRHTVVSTLSATRKMQNKIIFRCRLTLVRITTIRIKLTTNTDADVREQESLLTFGGITKWYCHFENQPKVSSND